MLNWLKAIGVAVIAIAILLASISIIPFILITGGIALVVIIVKAGLEADKQMEEEEDNP